MAEELQATLKTSDVVIFSYGGCPYCRKVTQAFKAKNVPFVEVDYDELDGACVSRSRSRLHLPLLVLLHAASFVRFD